MCLTLVLMRIDAVNPAAVLTLLNICSIAVLALLTAALVWFLELCKEKGMLLRRPYAVLTYWLWYKTRPKYTRYIARYKRPEYELQKPIPVYRVCKTERRTVYTWLYKILGGCVWCFGTWLASGFYILFIPDFGFTWLQALKFWPLFVSGNYLFMEIIYFIRNENTK